MCASFFCPSVYEKYQQKNWVALAIDIWSFEYKKINKFCQHLEFIENKLVIDWNWKKKHSNKEYFKCIWFLYKNKMIIIPKKSMHLR